MTTNYNGSDMRTRHLSPVIVFFLAILFVTSCKGTSPGTRAAPETTPGNANASAPQPNQPNAPSKPGDAGPAKEATGPPRLEGTYVMSEVQDGGVSTIISEMRTVINFAADGNYRRGSSKKGKLYHTDSGQYRVENGDKLVLTIQVSKKGMEQKLHSPPLQKAHKFTLSANGDELRLISSDGKVALFQRSNTVQK
jgi:hypothetical protein